MLNFENASFKVLDSFTRDVVKVHIMGVALIIMSIVLFIVLYRCIDKSFRSLATTFDPYDGSDSKGFAILFLLLTIFIIFGTVTGIGDIFLPYCSVQIEVMPEGDLTKEVLEQSEDFKVVDGKIYYNTILQKKIRQSEEDFKNESNIRNRVNSNFGQSILEIQDGLEKYLIKRK